MEIKVAKAALTLAWKDFPVDLNLVQTWMKLHGGDNCCGVSAGQHIVVHFIEEPTQDVKDAIQGYWEGITAESEEAISYVSAKAREQAVQDKKLSGKQKLKALGLTDDEVNALLG